MLNDKIFLHKVLEEGAEVARTESINNLKDIKKIIGFL